jgi:sigma-B regulation protein RsbU (phosphoserine phosphatase)
LSAEQTEDLLDLYETAPCGFISLSPDGKVFKANRTLAEWLGFEPEELVGKPIHDLLSFGGKIAFETHLAPLMRIQGHVHEIAFDMVAADGTKVPMMGNAAEKRSADGSHLFTRLTLFRAVDRRAYERTLLEATAKAEAETAAQREAALLREQFIAVLGHDLRNPLSAIAAGVALLAGREDLSERGKLVVREMAGSTDRATALIDDVLDFARGRLGGGIAIEVGETELESVLQQVVGEIRAIAPTHEIEVHIDISQPVLCDGGRIAQLASNLLANSVTHGDPRKPVVFEASTSDSQFRISVGNAGKPISAKVRERLFSPFFRGAARPSRNGLGLGLFIDNEFEKAHGGSIEVASNEEETRFTFTMPLDGAGRQPANESPGSSE